MDITPLLKGDVPVIQSYKNGQFKISGDLYQSDIMVGFDGVSAWDGSYTHLPDHDVLIIGTGKTQIFPDAKTRALMPMEVMATDAACRTYNALISDGRRVLACLKLYI